MTGNLVDDRPPGSGPTGQTDASCPPRFVHNLATEPEPAGSRSGSNIISSSHESHPVTCPMGTERMDSERYLGNVTIHPLPSPGSQQRSSHP